MEESSTRILIKLESVSSETEERSLLHHNNVVAFKQKQKQFALPILEISEKVISKMGDRQEIERVFREATSTNLDDYFTRDRAAQTAVCKKCNTSLTTPKSSTTSRHNHLKSVHQIDLVALKRGQNETVANKQPKITSKFESENLKMRLARMSAYSGWSFNSIAVSPDLRELLPKKTGKDEFKLSAPAVRRQVKQYGEEVIDQHKKMIRDLQEKKEMFCISFDEYTTIANKKFLGVVLHLDSDREIKLGLKRVKDESSAEHLKELVDEKLNEYGIDLQRDIICNQTDGCSTMLKISESVQPVLTQVR